jgi:glucuronokinase
MIIKTRAYPRAGLIGNPSDGFFGKTISFTFKNFCAEVVLYESPNLEILPSSKDHSVFASVSELVNDVRLHGYYGGIRLLKATVKRFYDYCHAHDVELHDKNFTLQYKSSIPHGVGLAGSSAIITACLRALMAFYGVSIPKYTQANLILAAELEELRISAGLQDRVVQVYQGLVYMDFNKELLAKRGYGEYENLDPALLPSLYIAYRESLAKVSGAVHDNIRERFERGEPAVRSAMLYWAGLTDRLKTYLLKGRKEEIGDVLNSNFDRRRKIYTISPDNLQMVEEARLVGASAKFTGSGGAIVGDYKDEKMFTALKSRLGKLKIKVIKPVIAPPNTDGVI